MLSTSFISRLISGSGMLFYVIPVVVVSCVIWGMQALQSDYMPTWGVWFMGFSFVTITGVCAWKVREGRPATLKNSTLPILVPPLFTLLTIGQLDFFGSPSDLDMSNQVDMLTSVISETLGVACLLMPWTTGLFFAAYSTPESDSDCNDENG